MARFILLLDWTDQGSKNSKETVNRAAAARKAWESIGAKFTIYWTLGKHDMVAIVEAADEEAVARQILALSSAGNVHATYMRAFDEQEMAKIVKS